MSKMTYTSHLLHLLQTLLVYTLFGQIQDNIAKDIADFLVSILF